MFSKKTFLIFFIIFLIIISGALLFYLKIKVPKEGKVVNENRIETINGNVIEMIPAEKSAFKVPTKVIFLKEKNGFQDSDYDGLSDQREEELGTDPLKRDTDDDGIDDKDEIRLGTDPLVSDTDGDGVLDSQESKRGTNPLVRDN